MLYTGPPLADGPVSLASVRDAAVHEWAERAVADPSMLYFGIFRSKVLVGQIFLHDRDDTLQEALVGYHLFTATTRGQGIGTRALRLLQRHVTDHLDLKRLIVITSRDNIPSQRLALTCGFTMAGAPREDPTGLLYDWKISR